MSPLAYLARLRDWILDGTEFGEMTAQELMVMAKERVDAIASESLPNLDTALACISCKAIQHPSPTHECVKCLGRELYPVSLRWVRAERKVKENR